MLGGIALYGIIITIVEWIVKKHERRVGSK